MYIDVCYTWVIGTLLEESVIMDIEYVSTIHNNVFQI